MSYAYTTEIAEAAMAVPEFVERFVNVEKFLGYCRNCPNYEVRWACPPYDFDPVEVWKKYREVKILGVKIIFDDSLAGKKVEKDEFQKIYREVLRAESDKLYAALKAEEDATPGSFLLYPGSCHLCGDKECDRRKHPCRHRQDLRYSIEALGGDVTAVTTDMLGFALEWVGDEGVMPRYLSQVGGLLVF